MNVHENARMTVRGRVLLVKRIVESGWRVALAADAAGVSVRTAYKWLARYRAGGESEQLRWSTVETAIGTALVAAMSGSAVH